MSRAIRSTLDVPTLVLRGDSDAYFLPVMYEHLAQHVLHVMIPAMIGDCSHWCPQDRSGPTDIFSRNWEPCQHRHLAIPF